jgi:methylmalonyl-CoA mutase C-terminal domain/subunit
MTIFPKIIRVLEDQDSKGIILMGGGVIPDDDAAALRDMGVQEILLQDTPPEAIVARVRELVAERGPR